MLRGLHSKEKCCRFKPSCLADFFLIVTDGHCDGEDDWITKMTTVLATILFVLLIKHSHNQCPRQCLCSGVNNSSTLRCIWAGLKVIPTLAPIDASTPLITLYHLSI